jgi:predicted MFS family arabinose efflux permease
VPDTAPVASQRGAGWRRGFGLTLALAMAIGPVLQYTLSALGPLIVSDLGLSRAQFGSLATLTFVAAALSALFVGRWTDRVGARGLMAFLFVGAGLSLLGAAAAPSYAWLLVAVLVCGAVQSLSNPLTNRLIAAHIGEGQRGVFLGIKQSGVQLGQLLVSATLPTAAIVLGWRGATVAGASFAVVGLAVAYRFVPAAYGDTRPQHGRHGRAPLPEAVWWLAGYGFLTGAGAQAMNVYTPLFGYEDLHLSATTAGWAAALSGGVGLAARMVWGHAAERVATPYVPMMVIAASAAVASGSFVVAGAFGLTPLIWFGAALFGASGIAANVVIMLALVRVVARHAVGTASGVLSVGLYTGFALGPVSFGLVVDASHSYPLGWGIVTASYAAAAVMAAVWRLRSGPARDPAAAGGDDALPPESPVGPPA